MLSRLQSLRCTQRVINKRFFSKEIKFEIRNRVGILTLNAPERLNAITVEMGDELKDKVDEIMTWHLPHINSIVVTGTGRAFSAGGDFEFLKARAHDTPEENQEIMLQFYKRALSIRHIPVPLISCVHGAAIGAGLSFACLTDIRYTVNSAKLGFTFTQLGLHPGMGASHYLPLLVGPQRAFELLTSGRIMNGEEAEKIGLVLKSFDTYDECFNACIKTAEACGSGGPLAYRECVKTIRERQDIRLEDSLEKEAYRQSINYAGTDYHEGLQAVLEKRRPVFTEYGSNHTVTEPIATDNLENIPYVALVEGNTYAVKFEDGLFYPAQVVQIDHPGCIRVNWLDNEGELTQLVTEVDDYMDIKKDTSAEEE